MATAWADEGGRCEMYVISRLLHGTLGTYGARDEVVYVRLNSLHD